MSRLFKIFLFLLAFLFFIFGGSVWYFSASLPKIIGPQQYRPMVVSNVISAGGEKIGEFFELRREPVPLEKIPGVVINAFIASEDAQFFSHKGIDLRGITRALIKNFLAGRVTQGGSTITQQVARNLLLTPERKLSRKIKEVILAMRIERELSKKEILYLYLNEIYLGHGAYGVQAAAQNYFGKNIWELNLAEAAMLAGLPQAPSRYSPLLNPKLAKERQIYVLGRMLDDGYMSKLQAIEARDQILNFLQKFDFNLRFAPYFVEHIRQYLTEKYGFERVYQEGFQIHTTLNLEFQKAANVAVEKGLRELDKRQGYRGPLKKLSSKESRAFLENQSKTETFEEGKIYEGVVTEVDDVKKKIEVSFGNLKGELLFSEMRWARYPNPDVYYLQDLIKKPSDALSKYDLIQIRIIELKKNLSHFSLEQEPLVQGGLLSFDVQTGAVRALIGGLDFSKSEFNRVLQGRRQVGSTFKPVIYGAALEKGYTPASIIIDSPIIYKEIEKEIEEKWKPRNFGEKFFGDTTFANALALSRNIVTIKIAQDIKIDTIVSFARQLGIESPLIEDLSMALGSSSLTLDEMCRAFAIFASEGKRVKPYFITKVLDREGKLIEEFKPPPKPEQVVSPQLAYLMTHLLKGVIQFGTGKNAKDLNWSLAGKTGTTNDYADAWFVGYNPDILTGVWVGFDERKKLGEFETGSRAALPIWKEYMAYALQTMTKRDFPIPDGIVFVNIDQKTGKLVTPETKFQLSQAFIEGTEPKFTPESEEKQEPTREEEEEFFKED
jgi:penicillin-binding protein 1A